MDEKNCSPRVFEKRKYYKLSEKPIALKKMEDDKLSLF